MVANGSGKVGAKWIGLRRRAGSALTTGTSTATLHGSLAARLMSLDEKSMNRPFNAARFSQGGCTALLAAATERNQAAVLSATQDDGPDVLNGQPDAQPLTEGAALAAIRTVIPIRRPHVFRRRITGQTTRSTGFRPALSQPLDATQRRPAPTPWALWPHTVVVRIPFTRQAGGPAFSAGEVVSLGVEVGFTHGQARCGVNRLLRVQRLPVPLLRSLD